MTFAKNTSTWPKDLINKNMTQKHSMALAALLAAPTLLNAQAPLQAQELSAQVEEVYVQAARGSFNHRAVAGLYSSEQRDKVNFLFSGTPKQTFEKAAQANKPAFVALKNDLVPGHLIGQTVEAIKDYEVTAITGAAKLPIEMCLLRSIASVESGIKLEIIASHPAALKQINRWKEGRALMEKEDPDGTSAAAEKVATGKLPQNTGAIGSCWLSTMLPDLIVVEAGIQDTADNKTLFGRLLVRKRSQPVSEEAARNELQVIAEQASGIAVSVTR